MKKTMTLAVAGAVTLSMAATALAVKPVISPKAPTITVNGVVLDTSKMPKQTGIPLRAFVEADGGSATWYPEENISDFYTEDGSITVHYADGSIQVGDQQFTGAVAVEGVTFVPVEALKAMAGVTVTERDGSYTITTTAADPMVKIAREIQSGVEMASTMKNTADQLKEYHGLDTSLFESVVGYTPMMINADTIIIGKAASGKMQDAKAALEAHRQTVVNSFEHYLPAPLEMAKNGKVVSGGDYVMLIISGDNEKAIEIFQAGVKNL